MLTLSPPAKINWFLEVLNKREDGYHNIRSLMQFVSHNDLITIEDSDEIEVITDAHIPLVNNLVYEAAILLRDYAGVKKGVKIRLRKEIPMSAGLGGGSSDAAFTMIGLNRLWNLALTRQELMALGGRLGSDIPFFFQGPAAIVRGRGEVVLPVTLKKSYVVLLVKPPVEVSSAWAYSGFQNDRGSSRPEDKDEMLTKENNNIKLICHALENGDFSYLSSLLRNDLESYVVRGYPVISDIKNTLLTKSAVFAAMSGSGPTVFGVFDSEQKAMKAKAYMSPNWCRVVKTVASDAWCVFC